MKRLGALLWCLLFALSLAAATPTPAGLVDTSDGTIKVDGSRQVITRRYDGKLIPLRSFDLRSISEVKPGILLSVWWDAESRSKSLTRHLIITDLTSRILRRSNIVDSSLEFEWVDNNFAKFEGETLYFGIYSPARMQFSYRDGKLAVDTGLWRGPPAPERYVEPVETERGPCYNVANVPECIAEIERYEAAKRARPKAKQPHPASSGASTSVTR